MCPINVFKSLSKIVAMFMVTVLSILLPSQSTMATSTLHVKKAVKKTEYVKQRHQAQRAVRKSGTGIASWYGPGFHGRLTASGQRFNQNAMTVAHKTLPFGTKLRVTNVKTGKSVIVTVNDRGPFVGNRILDLSKGAFQQIASTNAGLVRVRYEVLSVGDGKYRRQ